MADNHIPELERSLATFRSWLEDLSRELGNVPLEEAYAALHAALPPLRDRLEVNEAAQLGAQLPMVARGIFYEGWDPGHSLVKERRLDDFLAHVKVALGNRSTDPEAAARAVFAMLSHRVSAGEIDDVVGALPEDIRELWSTAA